MKRWQRPFQWPKPEAMRGRILLDMQPIQRVAGLIDRIELTRTLLIVTCSRIMVARNGGPWIPSTSTPVWRLEYHPTDVWQRRGVIYVLQRGRRRVLYRILPRGARLLSDTEIRAWANHRPLYDSLLAHHSSGLARLRRLVE